MPFIDPEASALITEMRDARGLSPEQLAAEIALWARAKGEAWTRGTVDAYTIRRIEGNPATGRPGFVPGPRIRFVLAAFFGVVPHQIWKPGRRVQVPNPKPARRRMKVAA